MSQASLMTILLIDKCVFPFTRSCKSRLDLQSSLWGAGYLQLNAQTRQAGLGFAAENWRQVVHAGGRGSTTQRGIV